MKLHKHAYLMLWLCFAGLGSAIAWALYSLKYLSWNEIMRMDGTGTTIFIIFVFAVGFVFSVSNIVWLEKLISKNVADLTVSVESIELEFEARETKTMYILWLLPILGFIGTLIGIMIVSGTLDQKIATETELPKIISHIQQAIGGIKTAAFTSIAGMITSAFLYLLKTAYRLGYLRWVVGRVGAKESHENA